MEPGSEKAARGQGAADQAEGLWSQYLEVGIGPDAEVFTKSQPMSAVGWGASVGLHPVSTWNNPEPESRPRHQQQGASSSARRSAMTSTCAMSRGARRCCWARRRTTTPPARIGPFIRLFDDGFGIGGCRGGRADASEGRGRGRVRPRRAQLHEARSAGARPNIAAQTIGRHHQYPDGLVLFLGTLFAPTQDR